MNKTFSLLSVFLAVVITVFTTLYLVYLFQSGKSISFNLSESKAARVLDEQPQTVESYTVIVEGFVGWLDVTFSGLGGNDSPVRRR